MLYKYKYDKEAHFGLSWQCEDDYSYIQILLIMSTIALVDAVALLDVILGLQLSTDKYSQSKQGQELVFSLSIDGCDEVRNLHWVFPHFPAWFLDLNKIMTLYNHVSRVRAYQKLLPAILEIHLPLNVL